MDLTTEQRREKQREAGLEFLPRLELITVESTAEKPKTAERVMASKTLDRLSREESYWGIAKHELKRASVMVPIYVTAALGAAWAFKRWIA